MRRNIFLRFGFEIFYAVFALSAVFLISTIHTQEAFNLEGRWVSDYELRKIEIDFDIDCKCRLNLVNKRTGEETHLNGIYETDFSKKPIALSIKKIPQLGYSLYTIIEFINVDSIRMEYFNNDWKLRPISFNTKTSILLKRIK